MCERKGVLKLWDRYTTSVRYYCFWPRKGDETWWDSAGTTGLEDASRLGKARCDEAVTEITENGQFFSGRGVYWLWCEVLDG